MTTASVDGLKDSLKNFSSFIRRRATWLVLCGVLFLGAAACSSPIAAQQVVAGNAQSEPKAKLQAERKEEVQQKKIDNPEAEDSVNVYRHSATVQKLAGVFGLPVETMARIFEVTNFALLMIVLVWGVMKLLPRLFPELTFRARTERIRTDMERARVATEEANRRLASVEERLSRLDSEIDTIRTQAEHETVLEEARLRAALEQEKHQILETAAADISAASKNAQNQLKRMAADIVIEHARRQIAVTPEADRSLVEGFLADVAAHSPGNTSGGVN